MKETEFQQFFQEHPLLREDKVLLQGAWDNYSLHTAESSIVGRLLFAAIKKSFKGFLVDTDSNEGKYQAR